MSEKVNEKRIGILDEFVNASEPAVNNKVRSLDFEEGSKQEQRNSQKTGRLVALDAVRGLAVIGMFIQHFALNDMNASIVSGNTTLLFILCGGISYSIMARRTKEKGFGATTFGSRMLARAVFIDIIGYLLIMLNTHVGVILPAYAALFVLALILVNRSTRALIITASALIVASPPLMIIGESLLSNSYLLRDIGGGPMSGVALAPAFVVGMVIGRIDLTKQRPAFLLISNGLIILIICKLLAIFVLPDLSRSFEGWLISVQGSVSTQPDPNLIWPSNAQPPMWHTLLWTNAHSASTFQTLTGLGAAFLVLGLVCLVPRKFSVALMPFEKVGRVALTMYAAQFVVLWGLQLIGIQQYSLEFPFGDVLVATVTLIIGGIIVKLPAGPLEAMMRRFDRFFSAPQPAKTKILR
ncbi:DUF418 domain-containing protein [Bacillus thuringiensis]|uniref:DUF418 domain-containing protein n=1 Tax=Bacillus thuringiensis TaxID=1428 RepID=UPI000A388534|nr:DUF418 domain-containing protein [Bacillus thuringiensis]OUA65518.1 hypothetical protein BK781_03000 [Bacillus thuringiensis serovar aizawai]